MRLELAIAELRQLSSRGRDEQVAWTAELEEARADTVRVESRAKEALADASASVKAALDAKHVPTRNGGIISCHPAHGAARARHIGG